MNDSKPEYPKHEGPDFQFFNNGLEVTQVQTSWLAAVSRMCSTSNVAITAIVSGSMAYICRGLSLANRDLGTGTLITTTILALFIVSIGTTAMMLERRRYAKKFEDSTNDEAESGRVGPGP